MRGINAISRMAFVIMRFSKSILYTRIPIYMYIKRENWKSDLNLRNVCVRQLIDCLSKKVTDKIIQVEKISK